MALVRFPEGQQRSGSTGGAVFSHNRYGAYIRARSIPVNPQTARQTAMRNYTRNLAIRWYATLTVDQRAAWDLYADDVGWQNKFGESVKLTGLNHYVRGNSVRLQAGLTIVDDGPVVFNLPEAPYVFTCSISEAAQQVSVAYANTEAWANEDDAAMLIYMGKPRGPARNFFNGPWRYVGLVEGDSVTPPTSPATPAVAWPCAKDQRVTCYARAVRADARLSLDTRSDLFCGA